MLVLLTAVILLYFLFRPDRGAAFGPAVALCPGPDLYGYACASGTGFAYIDALEDTHLYADEGTTEIALPFPFTFYGTTYTTVNASSNGTIHFGSSRTSFDNVCLTNGPATGMGDMIAPFWDDLSLQFLGYLETAVSGTVPNRIFIIEWDDVPRFGDDEDRVTFEVQLFENSNDILFLYEDVSLFEGNNGSSATIGLQSERQGVTLQHSCNQPAVADATRLRFTHPAEANADLGLEVVLDTIPAPTVTTAKGDVQELVTQLNTRGQAALTQLNAHWLNQSPPRTSSWEWVDLTGNGRSDLILLQHSTAQFPNETSLSVLTQSDTQEMSAGLVHAFSTRETAVSSIELVEIADLTQDGVMDALLLDSEQRVFVVTAVTGTLQLIPIPEQCSGSLGIIDTNNDGIPEIVRDNCQSPGRTAYQWAETDFKIGDYGLGNGD
ncbi:MAG: hypothetical protein DWQ04_20625 [Chloroflexi bacterium]|nr:MAG: hypothetical protein DWQ04_20625 [Chloroflexota bacterium]